MIVTAAMCYYDDDLELLEQCLRSLPQFVDRLVVADGRYERYMPGAPPASPKPHVTFIRRVCRDLELPVVVDVPRKPYPGQVAKRCRLLELAAEGTDWILGVDADHVFHGVAYSVRHEIERLDDDENPADAIDVEYYTPMNFDRPLKESAAGLWHESLAGDYALITGWFRALPGIRVERKHWWYSGMKDGRRHWIWGGDASYPRVRTHELKAPFTVEHRCLFRQQRHVLANREFCNDREKLVEQTGQEDPKPVLVAA